MNYKQRLEKGFEMNKRAGEIEAPFQYCGGIIYRRDLHVMVKVHD